MIRRMFIVLPVAAVALCLAGCRKETPPRPSVMPAAAPMPPPFAAQAAGGAMKLRMAEAPDRRIAYTESFVLELPAEAVQLAVQAAVDACLKAGGFVLHSRVDRQPDGAVQGSLSVRIAPDRYQAFAAALTAPPARVVSQAESAEDKTVAVLDVDKRLAAQTALRERLTQLLEKANGSVGDLVAVEKQLAEVQGTVESLTAQRDYLRTITDTVRVDVSYSGLIQQAGPFDLSPLRAAVDDFARTVIVSAGDVVSWVAMALPWSPLALIALWLLRMVIRRR